MRVLNVGSGSADIDLLPWCEGHDITRLDIDPANAPDLLMDVRDVGSLDAGSYDAVYCSHILEHFFTHEVEQIVKAFCHVLADDGACDVMVPDVGALLMNGSVMLDQVMYQAPAGPVTVHDMLYGYGMYQRTSEHPEYQAHHSGWSARRLGGLMRYCGFVSVFTGSIATDLRVIGFKVAPDAARLQAFGVGVDG